MFLQLENRGAQVSLRERDGYGSRWMGDVLHPWHNEKKEMSGNVHVRRKANAPT